MLLAPVNVILELDPHLPLCRLVPDERMLKQLLRVGPLVVVLDEHRLDEALKLFGPLFRLEPGRRIAWDEKERPHGMHVAERRLRFRHLQGGDAQGPEVGAIVVGCLRVVLAGDHLGRHPVGRPDERVAPPDGPVQLSAHAKINCT